jgi:hypothetical protein
MKPISFSRAAFAGIIYAIVMCLWVHFDRGLDLDSLAFRFATYFSIFTIGFYFLYNFIAKRSNKNADDS